MPDSFSFNAARRPAPDELDAEVDRVGKEENVPPALIHSVIHQESGGDPYAVSDQGAAGLMQLEPDTAAGLGVSDIFNWRQNLRGGTRYLKQGLDRYGGRPELAAAYYHGGPNEDQWGPKTANYADVVASDYRRRQASQPTQQVAQGFTFDDAKRAASEGFSFEDAQKPQGFSFEDAQAPDPDEPQERPKLGALPPAKIDTPANGPMPTIEAPPESTLGVEPSDAPIGAAVAGPAGRIIDAAREGWQGSPPVWASPEARQKVADLPVVGPLLAPAGDILSGAMGAGNAGFRALQQGVVETGKAIGNPGKGTALESLTDFPALGRDIAGYMETPEALAGGPHRMSSRLEDIAAGRAAPPDAAPTPAGRTPTLDAMGTEARPPAVTPEAKATADLADIAEGKPVAPPEPQVEVSGAAPGAPMPEAPPPGLKPVLDDQGKWIGYERAEEPSAAPVAAQGTPAASVSEAASGDRDVTDFAGERQSLEGEDGVITDPARYHALSQADLSSNIGPATENALRWAEENGRLDVARAIRDRLATAATDTQSGSYAAVAQRYQDIADATLERMATAASEPEPVPEVPTVTPPSPGTVRFFHGGDDPTTGGGRWVTTDPNYAANFRAEGSKKPVWFVDLQRGSPEELAARDEVNDGIYHHVEMPENVAKQMRPFSPGEVPEPEGVQNAFDRFDAPPAVAPSVESEPSPEVPTTKTRLENNPLRVSPFEPVPKEPERLSTFLRRMGGVQDVGGDIRSSLGGSKYRPGLINKNGLPLDEAALRAGESGYFPEFGDTRPAINDLREALHDDLNGRPVYSHHDEGALAAYQEATQRNTEIDRLSDEHGIPTQGKTRAQFFDELADRMSQDEVAAEAESQAAAHADEYAAAEKAAKAWVAEHPDESGGAQTAADLYGQSQARTLEDLEREHQQASPTPEGLERAARGDEPASPGGDQSPVPEGGEPRGDSAGAGRGDEAQTDLLGRPAPAPRAPSVAAATIRNDTRQDLIPGTEPSAVQAQAARDAQGRGALQTDVAQKPANEGLFAPDTSGQGKLYSFPGALFDPEAWRQLAPAVRPMWRAVRGAMTAVGDVAESIKNGLAPMRGSSVRAQAFAATFANDLRRAMFKFGEIDKEIERTFTPRERDQMGRALDAQSVFEQQVRDLPLEQQAAARAEFDTGATGVASLNPAQRHAVEMLDAISQDTWRQMQERGMVAPDARAIPYYFPRQMVKWSEEEGFTKVGGEGGVGRALDTRGQNLTTSGPMRREHLTPEETEAAARAKLGADTQLIRDIRSLPQRLAFAYRAIAGVDLLNKIEQVGRDTGVNLVVRGDIPGLLQRGDYFTMPHHPSFQKWTGSGWQPINIAREFEGSLRAVLTERSPTWYRAARMLQGGVMHAVMWSPFIHLGVELGRTFTAMPSGFLPAYARKGTGAVGLPLPGGAITLRVLKDGANLRHDLSYMDQAIKDGMAPLGQAGGWHVDPVSIADAASVDSRTGFVAALQGARDAMARGVGRLAGQAAEDIFRKPHQTLLWDQVFNLQVGIYQHLRDKWTPQYGPEVAGTMAAHEANRFAGALPPEHLSRAANMTASLMLFSRSFTLGNLGVMKDALTGAPSHVLARIEQMAGPEAARSARFAMQRKSAAAVAMDIGMFYVGYGLIQSGIQALSQGVQSAYDSWTDEVSHALHNARDNPLDAFGVFPQHWNEPGKTDRIYAGNDSKGRGVYIRLPPGKIGEEFMGWPTNPAAMLLRKSSVVIRPLLEDIFNTDGMGHHIYNPSPRTLADYTDIAGIAVKHIGEGWGPTSLIQGGHELYQRYVSGEPVKADPWVSALKIWGPATGLALVSQGFQGGPAAGELHAESERERYAFEAALPDIRKKIAAGDQAGAVEQMTGLRVPRALQRYYIRQTLHPGPTASGLRNLPMAPPAIQERVQRQLQRP